MAAAVERRSASGADCRRSKDDGYVGWCGREDGSCRGEGELSASGKDGILGLLGESSPAAEGEPTRPPSPEPVESGSGLTDCLVELAAVVDPWDGSGPSSGRSMSDHCGIRLGFVTRDQASVEFSALRQDRPTPNP